MRNEEIMEGILREAIHLHDKYMGEVVERQTETVVCYKYI